MTKATDKNALRNLLAGAVEEKLQQDPDAVTIYAPVAPVTRRPWQSKNKVSASEQAYQEELHRIEQEQAMKQESSAPAVELAPNIEDAYSGFAKEVEAYASRHLPRR